MSWSRAASSDKINIYSGVRQGTGYGDGFCSHHSAVFENYFESFPVFAEIPLQDRNCIHEDFLF